MDKLPNDIVAVTRHNPINHQAVVLAARCVFSEPYHMATDPFELNLSGEKNDHVIAYLYVLRRA